MLFQRFPIRYRHPDRTPIQLFLTEDRLLISCNFQFSDKALYLRPDGCDQTYAELIAEGIRMFWSGEYLLPLAEKLQPVTVEVLITSKPLHRAVPIRLRHMLFMPAHVRSPWYRHFWGLIRTGQIESIGTNWSREQPGAMILPYLQDPEQVRRIAAHEAGHLFGLGDAYGAIYRFYDAAPGTEWFMMNGNWAVQSTEILMMLRAHMTNRMQFFPRHFQWTRFRTGFIADIRLRLADAERRIEAHSQERRARNSALQPAPTAAEEPSIMIEPAASGEPTLMVEPATPGELDIHAEPNKPAVVEHAPAVDNEREESTAEPLSMPAAPPSDQSLQYARQQPAGPTVPADGRAAEERPDEGPSDPVSPGRSST